MAGGGGDGAPPVFSTPWQKSHSTDSRPWNDGMSDTASVTSNAATDGDSSVGRDRDVASFTDSFASERGGEDGEDEIRHAFDAISEDQQENGEEGGIGNHGKEGGEASMGGFEANGNVTDSESVATSEVILLRAELRKEKENARLLAMKLAKKEEEIAKAKGQTGELQEILAKDGKDSNGEGGRVSPKGDAGNHVSGGGEIREEDRISELELTLGHLRDSLNEQTVGREAEGAKRKEAEEKAADLQHQLSASEEKAASLKEQVEKLSASGSSNSPSPGVKGVVAKLAKKNEVQITELDDHLTELEGKLKTTEADLTAAVALAEKHSQEAAKEKERADALTSSLQELQESMAALEKTNREISAQLQSVQNEKQQLEQEQRAIQSKLKKIETENLKENLPRGGSLGGSGSPRAGSVGGAGSPRTPRRMNSYSEGERDPDVLQKQLGELRDEKLGVERALHDAVEKQHQADREGRKTLAAEQAEVKKLQQKLCAQEKQIAELQSSFKKQEGDLKSALHKLRCVSEERDSLVHEREALQDRHDEIRTKSRSMDESAMHAVATAEFLKGEVEDLKGQLALSYRRSWTQIGMTSALVLGGTLAAAATVARLQASRHS
eukprot:TRINITY_DN38397_c0_g1_i1.p1 TRINITY_DN38397_c0_g1~~TRINITY_DN38397_c0_g1_i1.p1  ORF type:complete len:611 (-),score=152.19 TRINITY_DN38397_c0_g1_i1:554-2386(-)